MISNNSAITIITPNLNGKRFLRICLDSVALQTFHDFFVIVVDNGSVDGLVEFIREQFTSLKIIEFKENKEFGAIINEYQSQKEEKMC